MVTTVETNTAIKKSTLQNFKKQVNQKGKWAISALYCNVTQMRNEDSDYEKLEDGKLQDQRNI